jgi:hypothetical protein
MNLKLAAFRRLRQFYQLGGVQRMVFDEVDERSRVKSKSLAPETV